MLQEHPHIGAVFWASMALWLLAAIAPFKRFMVLAKSHPDVSRSPSFETLCESRVWLMLGRQCAGVLAGCPCCKHADQGLLWGDECSFLSHAQASSWCPLPTAGCRL